MKVVLFLHSLMLCSALYTCILYSAIGKDIHVSGIVFTCGASECLCYTQLMPARK